MPSRLRRRCPRMADAGAVHSGIPRVDPRGEHVCRRLFHARERARCLISATTWLQRVNWMKRRQFLRVSGTGAAAALVAGNGCAPQVTRARYDDLRADLERASSEDEYWRRVRAFYTPPSDF